jgi:hypothetical protein
MSASTSTPGNAAAAGSGICRCMRRILHVFACLLVVLGGIGLFTELLTPWLDASFEMPLGQLRGIAVDSTGHLYCASQFYHRVHKYDSDGRFLLGWPIDTDGVFRIRCNRNDELEVATARGEMFYRFSSDGELLEQKNCDLYARFGSENEKQCRGRDGSVYEIAGRSVFPAVVRVASTGRRETVVSVPFRKWVFMGPFPAWFFFMGGGLVALALNKDKARFLRPWRRTQRTQQEREADRSVSWDELP